MARNPAKPRVSQSRGYVELLLPCLPLRGPPAALGASIGGAAGLQQCGWQSAGDRRGLGRVPEAAAPTCAQHLPPLTVARNSPQTPPMMIGWGAAKNLSW